jgi:hypothetical protein
MQKSGVGILCFHTAGLINSWSHDYSTLSNYVQWIYSWEAKSQTLKKLPAFCGIWRLITILTRGHRLRACKTFACILVFCFVCLPVCSCQVEGPPIVHCPPTVKLNCHSYHPYLIAVSLVSRVNFFKSHHNESQIEDADLSVICDLWHKYEFYFQNRLNQAEFLSFYWQTKTKFTREISYRSTKTHIHQN